MQMHIVVASTRDMPADSTLLRIQSSLLLHNSTILPHSALHCNLSSFISGPPLPPQLSRTLPNNQPRRESPDPSTIADHKAISDDRRLRSMRQATIFFFFLMAPLLAAWATAEANGEWARTRSRFLAGRDPQSKKCDVDRSVCYAAGSAGTSCCGQKCVDVSSDVFNCGKCGAICKFTESCCGGKCVNLTYDKRHCGGCFHKCPNGVKCFYGMCDYA